MATLPSYAEDFRGLPACPCQVVWIPVLESLLRFLGIIQGNLSIAQMIGLYEGSSNTHGDPNGAGLRKGGGATDFWVTGKTAIACVVVMRLMGADATWHRPKNWDHKGGSEHVHCVLRGCPHATVEAMAQLAAVDANGDGLVGDAPDPGPRPLSGRTWREGIEWAKQQEDDMPAPKDWSPEDWKALQDNLGPSIAKQVVAAILKATVTNAGDTVRKALRLAAGLPKAKGDE